MKYNKTIKKMLLNAYCRHQNIIEYIKGKTLNDCYKKPSERKCRIYDYLLEQVQKDKGFDETIISSNAHMFTFGYLYIDETHNLMFVYETPSYSYRIYVKELLEMTDDKRKS